MPATIAALAAVASSLHFAFRIPRSAFDAWDIFTLAYPLLLLALCVFGHTNSEIGRLWLPMMVPLVVPIARRLRVDYGRAQGLFIILAVAMILMLKNFQDF